MRRIVTPDPKPQISYSRQEALKLMVAQPRYSSSLLKPGSEDEAQAAVFEWAAVNEPRHPELGLLFAIPNVGSYARAQNAKLKLTGRKAGVPDVCLPVARGGSHGLFIELKRERQKGVRGVVSSDQKKWIALLREQGYRVEICEGARSAIELLEGYLLSG